MLSVHLFGPFALEYDGQPVLIPSQAGRSLLAYLLFHAHMEHSRTRLCDLFWPDLDESTARRRLSYALWEIGRSPGTESLILRKADTLGVDRAQVQATDVYAFEEALDHAAQQTSDQDALPFLRQAAALYTAPLLTDDYSDWVIAEQERLRERYIQASQRLIAGHKSNQDYEQALLAALALIQVDPLHEGAYQEAIWLYHRLGRPHDAQQRYDELCTMLHEEFGAEPAPETTALMETGPPSIDERAPNTPPFAQDIPLIGRKMERRVLIEHLERAMHGQGGVLFVVGEPGVGKSRLLDALAEDAVWRSALVMHGRAQYLAAQEAYGPLLSALGTGMSPLRAQQVATVLDRLWLSVMATLLPDLAEWVPGVSPLPDIPAEQAHIRLMEGLVRVILALGKISPTLLILEDLHWADAATLDILAYLSQRLAASRVLVVVSFRPTDARENPAVWAGLNAVDRAGLLARIALSPLSLEETGELMQRALHLAQPATRFAARIHHETGGNPLFVLESLRTLYAEGLLTQEGAGVWSTPYDADTTDYAELPLLPAVEETISHRLTRLDAHTRYLLNAMSVAGSQVSLLVLADMAGMTGPALLVSVGSLVQQGLLEETATAYRFSHDVVRQTIYAALPKDERQTLHSRMAGLLDPTNPAQAAMLAYHHEHAAAATEAAHFYVLAGEQAVERHAYRQALAYFDRAEALAGESSEATSPFLVRLLLAREAVLAVLGERERQQEDLEALTPQLLTDPQQQIERERRYGQMLAALGDYSGALERFDLALTLARGRKDRRAEAAILCATGESIYWNGDSLASVPILEQAIELSHQTQDLATQAQAEATLSAALSDLSRHQEALLAADRALVCYRSLGDRVGEADVLAAIGAVLCEQGELSKAEAGYAQALSIQREVGYRYAEARTLINWGAVAYMQGKVGDALEHFEAASQIGREIGSERAWNYAETNIAAVISTYIGDLPRGRRAVEEVIALQRSQENKPLLGQALGIQAQFDYLAGELAAAREHLNEALAEMAASAESPWLLAQIHQARAQAHLRLGQYREASEDIEAALAYCETHGFSDFTPGFFTTKAQILRAQNQIGPAGDAIQAGVAALTPGLFQAYLVHFEHYQVLQASGRPAEAGAALAEAVRALTEMLDTLSPKDQQASRNQIPEHRAILAAWAENQAIQTQTTLPRADAPLGRPLSADEQIAVTWTVETPQDRAIRSKGKRRRQQIVRLLHEAQSQNALPAYHHLAEALGVSQRTILRDMAALNQAGIDLPPTRGEQA